MHTDLDWRKMNMASSQILEIKRTMRLCNRSALKIKVLQHMEPVVLVLTPMQRKEGQWTRALDFKSAKLLIRGS